MRLVTQAICFYMISAAAVYVCVKERERAKPEASVF